MDQLLVACVENDACHVSEYVRQNPDDCNPDWQFLLDVASTLGHGNIVEILQNSGKVSNAQPLSDAAWREQRLPVDRRYVEKAKRLATFEKWPSDKPQIQETMAKAGFWYTGGGWSDLVRCYWCGEVVSGWEPSDDPWVRHARKRPSCRLVQLSRGCEFVAEVTKYRSTPPAAASHVQLAAAAAVGDTEYVRRYLASGREGEVGWYLVLYAAYEGKHEETAQLIQESGRVGIEDQLTLACEYGDHDHVRRVISEDRDAGQRVDWGELLEEASRYKHPAVMREIVTQRNMKYNRQLMLACLDGDSAFVEQHKHDFPADVKERKVYFGAALYSKHLRITEWLMQQDIVTLKECVEDMYKGEYTDILIHVINTTPDMNMELRPGLTEYSPGFTALHATCCSDRPDIAILRALVSRGAEVNDEGHRGRTALHMLCQGWDDDIRKMIQGDGQVQPQPGFGPGKLIKQQGREAQGGEKHIGCMKFLIQHGAMVNATDERGQSPLHLLACCQASRYIGGDLPGQLEALLEKEGDMDQQDEAGMTPIALCALHNNTTLMKILIEKGCDVNKDNKHGKSPLQIACEWEQLEAATILADNPNVNIDHLDRDRVTPISAACGFGHTQIVSMLISKKAKAKIPDKDEKCSIHKAVERRHHETVQILIDHGINIDARDILGKSPLHYAVANDDEGMISTLIGNNCKLDVVNNLGETPMITSIGRFGAPHKAVIQILLEKGADLSKKNIYGDSVLSKAVEKLDYKLMLQLEDHGIDFQSVNNKKQGLFHTLTNASNHKWKYLEAATILADDPNEVTENIRSIMYTLEKHLNINSTDINQQTPLHLAAHAGCVRTTKLLLQRGADVSVRDKFNFLPIMWAVPHEEVFRLLWKQTVNHLGNEDWKILITLGNWHDNINLIKEQLPTSMLTVDRSKHPQKFNINDWFCNKDLNEFYTKDKRRLTFAEFEDAWLSSLQKLTYVDHSKIVDTLSEFIEDVLREVSASDPLMSCFFRLSGSEKEKCKVIATDEMDALSVMTKITFDMFEEPQGPGHEKLQEFVKLHCKSQFREKLERVLDRDHYLSRTKLYHHYSAALSEVLAKPELWAKYKNIQRITHKDIAAGNCTITPLTVLWSDDVYPLLEISIDMVLSIDLPQWRPSWANKHPLLDEMECLIVPKWKAIEDAIEDDNLLEAGISHWRQVFYEMPPAMKNGYRMAKVVKEVCPQIVLDQAEESDASDDWSMFTIKDCFTSYMLKQCIVKQYAEVYYGKPQQNVQKKDREWAITIYDMLEESFKEQKPKLSSFFIEEYNLLHDKKFENLRKKAIKYAQLCKFLLGEKTSAHFRKAYMGIDNSDDYEPPQTKKKS